MLNMLQSSVCYNELYWYNLTVHTYFWNTQPGRGRGNKSKLDCFVVECWRPGWKESLGTYKKSVPHYKQPKTWCCIPARGDLKVFIHFSVKMLRVSTAAMLTKCWSTYYFTNLFWVIFWGKVWILFLFFYIR